MTPFEKYFVDVIEFFEEHGNAVMVHGSTLLNIVRGEGVGPRQHLRSDREINLYILAEDMNDDLFHRMRDKHLYFHRVVDNGDTMVGLFYSKDGKGMHPQNHWSLDPGFVLLTLLWQGKTTRYKRHNHRDCVLIPEKFVNDKSEWSNIDILGKRIKGPAHMGEYLDYYYGDWWQEDVHWHWSRSPHYLTYDELKKRGEVC